MKRTIHHADRGICGIRHPLRGADAHLPMTPENT